MGFIDDYMEMSKEQESPRNYFYWSALTALSAIKKRDVYIERYSFRTYPNIFVLLVGDSGLRKGAPIAAAKELVSVVNNTRIISGRSSVQGIISALGTAYTTPEGKTITKAYGYISSSEFSSSIVRDQDALTILTDLFDSCYHDKWVDTLRSGKVELHEPSITLLAGINPTLFEDYISPTAISGGFIGRLFLVFETEKANINALLRPPKVKYNKEHLIEQLKRIAEVKGEMILTEEAKVFYETWYAEFEAIRKQKKVKDKTGSINRIGENVLKISILLSLSRQADVEIIPEDIENAIKVCQAPFANVNKTVAGQGKSAFSPQIKLVLNELTDADNHEVERSKLLRDNYGGIDAPDLDRVIDTLLQAGGINQEVRGGKIYYKLTEQAVEHLKKARF